MPPLYQFYHYNSATPIQDKIFASNGSLIFDHDNHNGLMGDVILVNGAPWPKMEVTKRKYRFRVLNASNSRAYKLALSTGDDLIIVGSDGGLLTAPVSTKDLRIGMAERYEFIIDFSTYPIGTKVILQNLGQLTSCTLVAVLERQLFRSYFSMLRLGTSRKTVLARPVQKGIKAKLLNLEAKHGKR